MHQSVAVFHECVLLLGGYLMKIIGAGVPGFSSN